MMLVLRHVRRVPQSPAPRGVTPMTEMAKRWSSSIVTPTWLRESGASDVRILDCGHPIEFQRAHIPRATSFYGFKATNLKDTRGGTGVMSKAEFTQILEFLGLDGKSTVVFYDDELSIGAARAWWVFHHYGYPKDKLKILDGGWKQWVEDVKEVSTHSPDPIAPSNLTLGKETGKLVGLEEVQNALLSTSAHFLDTRTHAEYVGAQDNGNRRVGHVPGATHFEWKEGVDVRRNGRFKSMDTLKAELIALERLTEDRTQPVITYCQRGIRAAHTAFVLQEILGYEDVRVYEDSMLEYLNREDTAIEH